MRRLRVLQLIAGLAIGDQCGGAEAFAVRLASQLTKQEFDVAVFAMWRYDSPLEKQWLKQLVCEDIPVQGLVPFRKSMVSQLTPIVRSFWSFLSDFRPDIINSHSQRSDPLNLLARRLHPSHPYAMRTVHIDQPWLNRPYMDFVFNRLAFPLVFDREVAISKEVQRKLDGRWLAKLFGRRSSLCYNGIGAAAFVLDHVSRLSDSPSWPITEGRACIAVVGRLTRQKGHADLLRAMQIMNQQRNVDLLVIGSGPLDADLKRQARDLGVDDCVYFLGSRDDVMDILPQVNMVVSSSLWEGLPTVLLEAMALRVPVVATDVSGSRELVQQGVTGVLVPPGEPGLLAEACLQVLGQPEWAHLMTENAHQLAMQFTIENVTQQYVQIYHELAGLRL